MKKLTLSLLIGFIAGVIDVIPMIVQNIDKYACVSAFVFWSFMGIIISYNSFKMKGWLKGLVTALLSASPIMVLVSETGIFSIIPIFIMTCILGTTVGYLTEKFNP